MLLTLSDELLLMVIFQLQYASESTQDVLPLRFVCKRLARIAEEIAFSDIKVQPDDRGVQAMIDLSRSPLQRRVRKLHFYFEAFDETIINFFQSSQDGVKRREEERATKQYCTPTDLKEGFAWYQEGYLFQAIFEQQIMNTTILAAALGRFANLEAIQLSQSFTDWWLFNGVTA